jgi:hypothetical protein
MRVVFSKKIKSEIVKIRRWNTKMRYLVGGWIGSLSAAIVVILMCLPKSHIIVEKATHLTMLTKLQSKSSYVMRRWRMIYICPHMGFENKFRRKMCSRPRSKFGHQYCWDPHAKCTSSTNHKPLVPISPNVPPASCKFCHKKTILISQDNFSY